MGDSRKSTEKNRKRRYTSSVSSLSSSRSRSRDRFSKKRRRSLKSRRDYSRDRTVSRRRSFDRSPSSHRRTRYYGSRENPFKSRVIGVFGLHAETKEDKLLKVFTTFGAIEHISIIHDAKTGNSRGFGFIYYATTDQATRARTECNGMTLDGKRIRVDYSITKRAHTPTPGVYMGSPRERRHHSGRHRHYSDYDSVRYSRSRSRWLVKSMNFLVQLRTSCFELI